MKLKLFNGTLTSLSLQVVTGGYDPEAGRVTVVVRGEADQAGTLLIDVSEANRLMAILNNGLPKVEKVASQPAE